jgi:MFS family permease
MLAVPISTLVGYILSGWLNQLFGWRTMFMLLGLPGLAPALLAWLTLREPRRAKASSREAEALQEAASDRPPTMKDVFDTLRRNATFRNLLSYWSVMAFFGTGILQWQPAFFIRTYGLKSGELGTWFAVTYGLGGLLGTYCFGVLASRFAANDERRQLLGTAVAVFVYGVSSTAMYVSPNYHLAFTLMAIAAFTGTATNGPVFATVQTLVPERMRAIAIATIYLFSNLIGAGLGPLLAGALSDAFRPWVGEESLRYALLALCPGYLWGAWHLWRASRTVTRDLAISPATEQDLVVNAVHR